MLSTQWISTKISCAIYFDCFFHYKHINTQTLIVRHLQLGIRNENQVLRMLLCCALIKTPINFTKRILDDFLSFPFEQSKNTNKQNYPGKKHAVL